ncbi:MAG: hypothetical protein IJG46_06790 [Prevotella sp.]|nr:hypothetical protein [Prevotella sp.]
MRTFLTYLMLFVATLLYAEGDPHSLRMMGIPLEGHADSVRQQLMAGGFAEWGQSDDGEDLYFRGNFYGIRAKLILTKSTETHLVTSAYVTIGPYSTEAMITRNLQYFLYKLQKEHGEYSQRDDSYFFLDDFGSVKLSLVDNGNGSRDIRVLYFPNSAFYKDAISTGYHGHVQEVVTENAVAEEQFMRFGQDGKLENPDLTHRQYNRYGYLISAQMTEQTGHSNVQYEYDDHYRLKRRILANPEANITYINEYNYNERGEIATQYQKVYDKNKECILTITMRNNYLTRDDEGNWTTNSLSLSYWEKGQQSQQTTVLQKRTLTYWD